MCEFSVARDRWVLMSNHYHLLAETPQANLVNGMQWLQTAYTVWFNGKPFSPLYIAGRPA